MFIKLSFMFMIDKYVMFDWYTFVKPIMTFQLKSVMYGSLKECWNTAKNISDESVGLSRCHTFIFFLRALVLNNNNARRTPAHWPSALWTIFESRVDMGCDKNLQCLLH